MRVNRIHKFFETLFRETIGKVALKLCLQVWSHKLSENHSQRVDVLSKLRISLPPGDNFWRLVEPGAVSKKFWRADVRGDAQVADHKFQFAPVCASDEYVYSFQILMNDIVHLKDLEAGDQLLNYISKNLETAHKLSFS